MAVLPGTDAILEGSAQVYRRLVLVDAVGVAVGALPPTTVLRYRLGGSE